MRRRIDGHLVVCADCSRVLAQWREVVRLTGRLADDEVDRLDDNTRALLAAFRDHPRPPTDPTCPSGRRRGLRAAGASPAP